MKINKIKINGVHNPVGFSFDYLNLSYQADEEPKKPLILQISTEENFGKVIYTQRLKFKESFCTPISFKPNNETRYFIRINCGDAISDTAYFETGTDFNCRFITPCENLPNPVIFRDFKTTGEVESARLYVTGLGLYEAFINGVKAGNEFLTPNCNDYDAYLQYQTYDITNLVKDENDIEIYLGNGWYKGRFGLNHKENIYGEKYVTAAKIVIRCKDGKKQVVSTDESWSAKSSDILSGNIYDGETWDMTAQAKFSGVKFDNKKYNVIPRISLPVVVKQQIIPKLYISPKGEKILDFKQNFAGFVSFNVPMKNGQTIRLQAAEVLQNDCFYRENLRTAKAEFVYTSDGKRREIRPKFTFYGFRYMLVEGLDEVNAEDFKGNVIYSDMEHTVGISTDNLKMNRLLENCLWGQKSNFVDVPTDCPQRDERLGWTGDAEVFSKTACLQMNCLAFYNKYLKDIAVDQEIYGAITTYSPAMKEGEIAGSIWSDAATIIPFNAYTAYGDKQFLKTHYPMLERYVESLKKQDDENGGKRLYNFGFHLGDWLSQDGVSPNALKGATDEYFIASAYYYRSVCIATESANVLGYKDKAKQYSSLAKEIKSAILKEYFTPSGKLSVDTQTAYVLCVLFGIYKSKKRLTEDFKKRIIKDGYKIKGGFVGATQLIQALIDCGLTDDAFDILYSERYPSWLACVNLGATTIWERWNSLNEDGTISGTGMNSFNHYSFGAVAEAFYSYVAGLRTIYPGYKKVVIEPKFNYRLKQLNFEYDSVSGIYKIAYKIADGKITLNIVIPYGASAVLKLDGRENTELKGGEYCFEIECSQKLLHPYSIDLPVCVLLENAEASEVFKKELPVLHHVLSSSDMGFNGETLRGITSLRSFFVPQEKMADVNNKLQALTV